MQKILQHYFAQHHQLTLSGIGSFSVEAFPAKIDIVDKLIYPPVSKVIFKENEQKTSDDLINFLKNEYDLNPESLSAFEQSLLQKLQNEETVTLDGIGVLENKEGSLSFTPIEINELFEPVHAERVIRQNSQHSVTVGEQVRTSVQMQESIAYNAIQPKERRWWIGALILAAIGISVIAFYYFRR